MYRTSDGLAIVINGPLKTTLRRVVRLARDQGFTSVERVRGRGWPRGHPDPFLEKKELIAMFDPTAEASAPIAEDNLSSLFVHRIEVTERDSDACEISVRDPRKSPVVTSSQDERVRQLAAAAMDRLVRLFLLLRRQTIFEN